MSRQTDEAARIADVPAHRLGNPVEAVRTESIPLGELEFLGGTDQAQRTFLNQIEVSDAAAAVAPGDGVD